MVCIAKVGIVCDLVPNVPKSLGRRLCVEGGSSFISLRLCREAVEYASLRKDVGSLPSFLVNVGL